MAEKITDNIAGIPPLIKGSRAFQKLSHLGGLNLLLKGVTNLKKGD